MNLAYNKFGIGKERESLRPASKGTDHSSSNNMVQSSGKFSPHSHFVVVVRSWCLLVVGCRIHEGESNAVVRRTRGWVGSRIGMWIVFSP
jgi:hypothetical protein